MNTTQHHECSSCHQLDAWGDLTEIAGQELCEHCLARDYLRCHHCQELVLRADATEQDGEHYCRPCFQECFGECFECEEIVPTDELCDAIRRGDDVRICEDCRERHYGECDHCSAIVHEREQMSADDRCICESCYEDHYFTCESCNNFYHNDDYGSNGRCQSCEENNRSSEYINPYGTTRARRFYGQGTIFYGIELEVECPRSRDLDSAASDTLDCFEDGFVELKEDGSLSHGFEIVSQPATVSEHKRLWEDFFKSTPSGLKSWDTTTCGQHVHVSRKGLTQLQIAKTLVFLNGAQNERFVTEIAGRSSSHWAEIKQKRYGDATRCPNSKYEALNLRNDKTIEFRIFRGTLCRETFFKNLEFCEALLGFCGQCECSLADCQEKDKFIQWIHPQRKKWPMLWNRLKEHFTRLGLPIKDKQKESTPVIEK